MIELHLTRGDNQEGVRLRFPTTPAEIGEAFALLDTVSRYAGDVRILDVKSPVANIGQYVRYADLNSREDMQKLNTLAERIGGISFIKSTKSSKSPHSSKNFRNVSSENMANQQR